MIAVLRTYTKTKSQHLATVDLRKYNRAQINQSMGNHAITDDEIQIVAFNDWQVSINLSLSQAYQLKEYIEEHCSGDETLVKELLKKRWSIDAILSRHFEFIGEGDLNLLTKLFENRSAKNIALIVYSMGNGTEIISKFISTGKIIPTPKGFYLSQSVEN